MYTPARTSTVLFAYNKVKRTNKQLEVIYYFQAHGVGDLSEVVNHLSRRGCQIFKKYYIC